MAVLLRAEQNMTIVMDDDQSIKCQDFEVLQGLPQQNLQNALPVNTSSSMFCSLDCFWIFSNDCCMQFSDQDVVSTVIGVTGRTTELYPEPNYFDQ